MSRLAHGAGRALKWALIVSGSLIALMLAIVLAVLLLPGIVLNEAALRQAGQWVNEGDSDARVDWGRLAVEWEVPRFLSRRIRIDFEDLRVDVPDRGGTFQKRGSIVLVYDLRRIVPRLREFGPVRLGGGHTALRLDEDAQEEPAKDTGASGAPGLPAWLRGTALRDILIDEQSWTVATGEQVFSGVAFVHALQEGSGETGIAAFTSHAVADGPLRHDGELRLAAVVPLGALDGPWTITLESAIDGAEIGRGRTGLSAELDAETVQWRLTTDWRHPQGTAQATVRGAWDGGALRAGIDARASPADGVDGLAQPVVSVENCRVEWKPAARRARQSLAVDCPFGIAMPVAFADGIDAGEREPLLVARVVGSFETAMPFDAETPVTGRVEFLPETVWLARAQGHARASASIVPAAPDPAGVTLDVDLRVEMPAFQQAVAALAETAYAVPAPLHTLQGPLSLRIHGRGGLPEVEIAAVLETRLSSGHQRLAMDLGARLRPQGDWPEEGPLRLALTADLLLRDVALRLPPLDLGAVPGVMPDARIQEELEEAEAAIDGDGPLDYSLRVRTDAGHAIEISAPVSGEMIPLSADLTIGSEQRLQGRIGIGEFPLEAGGFERRVEGGELYLRLSDVKEEATGELAFDAQGRSIDMSLAEMSGLFTPLPEPKPPLAIGQLVTSLLIGSAIDLAVVSQGARDRPATAPREAPTSLEFQYRY